MTLSEKIVIKMTASLAKEKEEEEKKFFPTAEKVTLDIEFIVNYVNLCRGIFRAYQVESSRNMYIRGREHLKDMEDPNKNYKSALKKHIVNEHHNEGEKVQFEMVLTGTFNKTVDRQIEEGIRIKNHERDTHLNSKSEFKGPSVFRIEFL